MAKKQIVRKKSTPKDELDKRIYAIAAKIKKLRLSAGYTNYEDFAYEFDLGRMQYWRLENGKNMTLETLFRIVDAHKLNLEEFFKGIE